MKTFGTIEPRDYTVDEMFVSAPMSWELVSGSSGIVITEPDLLQGAITVQRASNTFSNFYDSEIPYRNEDTGTYEYLLYRSLKHLFYTTPTRVSGSTVGYLSPYLYNTSVEATASINLLPSHSYVINIGQQFYGDRIKPGTFELATEIANKTIFDDNYGNLYISESGTATHVGNIFYNFGIAVVKHHTSSAVTSISTNGLKLVNGSQLYVDYESDVRLHRHEAYVRLTPTDFNFSLFNPSVFRVYQASGSVSSSAFVTSMQQRGISPSGSSTDTYNIYNLMNNSVIKPYITSVGLYNNEHQLLAVAKLSEPIQRTFDVDQIFIVRFDTD
jgi:hypothetical protein